MIESTEAIRHLETPRRSNESNFLVQNGGRSIWERVDSLRARYRNVEKCAGAGHMGRDIVCASSEQKWDNSRFELLMQLEVEKLIRKPSH